LTGFYYKKLDKIFRPCFYFIYAACRRATQLIKGIRKNSPGFDFLIPKTQSPTVKTQPSKLNRERSTVKSQHVSSPAKNQRIVAGILEIRKT